MPDTSEDATQWLGPSGSAQACTTCAATVFWPAPPGSDYSDATQHAAPLACVVHFARGRLRQGRLFRLDFLDATATVGFASDRPPVPLRFDQFLSLALTRPLTPDPLRRRASEGITAEHDERRWTAYRLLLKDGKELRGKTMGYIEKPVGLFLFPPIDREDRIARMFVPRQACLRQEFGQLADKILIDQSDSGTSTEQLEQVAALKRTLRSHKLGEILCRSKVDLEQLAVEAGALRRVPLAVARRLQVLPLMASDNLLVVGIDDVSRTGAIDELEFVTQTKVVPVPIAREAIERMLETCYLRIGNRRNGAAPSGAVALPKVTPLFPAKRHTESHPPG